MELEGHAFKAIGHKSVKHNHTYFYLSKTLFLMVYLDHQQVTITKLYTNGILQGELQLHYILPHFKSFVIATC